MISRAAIDQRVREWGLRHGVVEKDYVLGWLLWGIGRHPALGQTWIFKGGTCLKKCYIETYRFSEDLDFTVVGDGPIDPADVAPLLDEVLVAVSDESGIDFSERKPALRARNQPGSVEGRVYYRGPLATPAVASVKLDLSATELLARESERRPIAHPYEPEETLPEPADVACYVFEEVFAEKLRAMGERSRPRDLYDIVNLYRRNDLRILRDDIHAILVEKCAHKGIEVPTLAIIEASGLVPELESEWANMLGHQLPALPPFDQFWDALAELFGWLAGVPIAAAPAPIAMGADEDPAWAPPATVGVWGTAIPSRRSASPRSTTSASSSGTRARLGSSSRTRCAARETATSCCTRCVTNLASTAPTASIGSSPRVRQTFRSDQATPSSSAQQGRSPRHPRRGAHPCIALGERLYRAHVRHRVPGLRQALRSQDPQPAAQRPQGPVRLPCSGQGRTGYLVDTRSRSAGPCRSSRPGDIGVWMRPRLSVDI